MLLLLRVASHEGNGGSISFIEDNRANTNLFFVSLLIASYLL